VEINDAALAASDADSRRRPAEHQGYYSRVRTNTAALDTPVVEQAPSQTSRRHGSEGVSADAHLMGDALTTRFAAVVAPTACLADALVKCVMLCQMDTSTRVLRDLGATRISCDSRPARAAPDHGRRPPLPAPR
jgi:hypothetical protein